MRLLLVVAVSVVTSACVTERGVRTLVAVKPLSTRCEAGPVTARVDDAVRDRVRLVFTATERCEEQSEQVYEVEQKSRLPVWLRVVLSVPAAAAVGGPIAIGLVALDSKPGVHLNNAGDALFWVILGPALLAGGATFAATSAAQTTTTKESERQSHSATQAATGKPLEGAVTWTGAPGPPRELAQGALELTLAEAEGLDTGALSLDGAPVTLPLEMRDQLGFLPLCAEALRGFEAASSSQEPEKALRARLKRAEACEWNGWSFAHEVVSVLTPLVPATPLKR